MDICTIDGYRQILKSYKACFDALFPDLCCECREESFCIGEEWWRYTSISGVDCSMDYLIVEIKKEYRLFLPVTATAYFHTDRIAN